LNGGRRDVFKQSLTIFEQICKLVVIQQTANPIAIPMKLIKKNFTAMDTKKSNHNILKGYNLLFYFAGSMIMHEPSEECIVDFWEKGILRSLPVNSSNPNFIKAASQLRESFTDRKIFGKLLHEDFIRLFSPDSPLAPAYESKYYNELSAFADYNPPNVTEFYNSYGWKSRFKGKIDDDHLGIELLFLTLLIDRYQILDDEACSGEMRKEIRRFINTHILSWVPIWNNKIQNYADTLSFKGIGNLILACSEDIFLLFDQKYIPAPSTNALKN
jgi:putative dimethyl sulfoxide reductase chaperone